VLFRSGVGDCLPEETLGRTARNDRRTQGAAPQQISRAIDAKVAPSRLTVGSMTAVAMLDQHRPDMLFEERRGLGSLVGPTGGREHAAGETGKPPGQPPQAPWQPHASWEPQARGAARGRVITPSGAGVVHEFQPGVGCVATHSRETLEKQPRGTG